MIYGETFRRAMLPLLVVLILSAGCGGPTGETPPAATTSTSAAEPAPTPAATEPTTIPRSDESQVLVNLARDDLREKLCMSRDMITVEQVEPFDFADTSLGVPEPDHMYSQVITPGYIIHLAANGEVYVYHGSDNRIVFAPDASTAVPTCITPTPTSAG